LSTSALYLLVAANVAATAAILIVALLRKPLRQLSGPQAACWIWLLVPAFTLAVVLPVPPQVLQIASHISASTLALPLPAAEAVTATSHTAVPFLVWLTGCVAMATFMTQRQKKFVRSLSEMTRVADGTYRSASVTGPVLIGILRPRIIVPTDFDVRYGTRERALMLAHEQAHLERGDILVGAVALLWLCVFWFNPLMYWAVSRLRFDQELACDARVLSALHQGRRQYARTLLKAQLATDSPWCIPISCHWLSAHPLRERIAMLKRPFPGSARRWLGIFLTSALLIAGGVIVWTARLGPAPVQTLQRGDVQFEFFADRMVKLPNGDLALSGNVSLAASDPDAAQLTYEADRIASTEDITLMEGDVRLSLGQYTLMTDQATVDKKGTLSMASATLARAP
jgi:bla regulator protein BlaR1